MKNAVQFGIITDTFPPESAELIDRLTQSLNLPLSASIDVKWDYYFHFRDNALELCCNRPQDCSAKPMSIDFSSGSSLYRFKFDRTIHQPLARAVGIKPGIRPKVCDLTAGFGNDAFVLAGLGCNVTLVERSPFIWALLEDGLRRGRDHHAIGTIMEDSVHLYFSDAITFLEKTKEEFDTLYLDPMYPKTGKRALTKIKMRILRELVGTTRTALICSAPHFHTLKSIG